MTYRIVQFRVGERFCHVDYCPGGEKPVCLILAGDTVSTLAKMTPADALAMANALYEIAHHAENVLPTGLGESVAA